MKGSIQYSSTLDDNIQFGNPYLTKNVVKRNTIQLTYSLSSWLNDITSLKLAELSGSFPSSIQVEFDTVEFTCITSMAAIS